ncbi:hypothetical protein HMPREF1861_01038 [Corynebacterium kroppenstedtii]|nr:hypothetical protein HMPREF1861_01038 [Corynebacterium kroppenstedtii]
MYFISDISRPNWRRTRRLQQICRTLFIVLTVAIIIQVII